MSDRVSWTNPSQISTQSYHCGYCGNAVASDKGIQGAFGSINPGAFVAICPHCSFPTYLSLMGGVQVPGVRAGNEVSGIDEQSVLALYNEARDCTGMGANTAAVLGCRKILMHVAVSKGAEEGGSFLGYVDFLAKKGYVPPDGQDWVDHIRKVGNQANHEISIATADTAQELLSFVEMLLKFVYEFPHRIRSKQPPSIP